MFEKGDLFVYEGEEVKITGYNKTLDRYTADYKGNSIYVSENILKKHCNKKE